MLITVFVDEKPVYITDKLTEKFKKLSAKEDTVFLKEGDKVSGPELVKALQADKAAALITGKDIEAIKENFFSQFTVIEAAGGIVQNPKKDILFIFRRGKWDLPKGKLEKGESIELCAEREIEEETGVQKLTLKRKIGETYHIYKEKGKTILKTSHWFYFTCPAKQIITPQTEEDITSAQWVATQQIKTPMLNTYENIREIMRRFFDEP